MERKTYVPPTVEVVCVQVEVGYAMSEPIPINEWNYKEF